MTTPTLHLSIPVRDLAESRSFYEDVLGCKVGRVREDWIDVWFFGMQLTLAEIPAAEVDTNRHFGVALQDEQTFVVLIDRLRQHDVHWLCEPKVHTSEKLSGKTSGMLADPSGNLIELKYYPADSDYGPPID